AGVRQVGELPPDREIGRRNRDARKDGFRFVGDRADDRGFDLRPCGGGGCEKYENSEDARTNGAHRSLRSMADDGRPGTWSTTSRAAAHEHERDTDRDGETDAFEPCLPG